MLPVRSVRLCLSIVLYLYHAVLYTDVNNSRGLAFLLLNNFCHYTTLVSTNEYVSYIRRKVLTNSFVQFVDYNLFNVAFRSTDRTATSLF